MIAGGDHTNIYAFSECPLKSPSFGTFLGEARKVHSTLFCCRKVSFFNVPEWLADESHEFSFLGHPAPKGEDV